MCKFSIIIPCYNATEYVDRAIKSAVNQTYGRDAYEIIAVNDASTDDTLSKLEKWQSDYPDIVKIISYDVNLRQGGARNIAIKASKGEYICFLDSDDRIAPDCLEIYGKLIKTTNADMIVTRHVDEIGYFGQEEIPTSTCEPQILNLYNMKDNPSEIISEDLGYVCCAAYRKEIIINNEIWFPEHLAFEDIYWPRVFRTYVHSICVSDAVTYYRFDNPVSTMNKKNASHHIDRLTVYEMLLAEYDRLGIITKEYEVILNETMETYYFNSYFMFFTRLDEIPDVYARIRNTIYRYFPDWESRYDDSSLPMIFQYMIKLLIKASNVSPKDLIPFKESMLEMI